MRCRGVAPPTSRASRCGPLPTSLLSAGGRHGAVLAVRPVVRKRFQGEHLVEGLDDLPAWCQYLHPGVVAEPCPGRDEPAHDYVLLESSQIVRLAGDGRLRQDARRLLERGG